MPTRTHPYGAFNFLVNVDGGETFGGFSDVSGLGTDITIAEYRNGNEKENHVRKVPGIHKVGDVTLKRGLIGATDLYEWIDQTRNGDQAAPRSVTISMQDEAHEGPVMTWRLTRARPMRYTAPSLNGKGGTDVAIEELVLSCEDLVIE
jgi:phage tail-like protein